MDTTTTYTELMELMALDRNVGTIERLIPVRYPEAESAQLDHFRREIAAAKTTAAKQEVARDWLAWMAS